MAKLGAGGRPRKPSVIKKAQGTWRARQSPKNEPQPEIKLPAPPACLDGIGKAEWRRAGKILEKHGLVSHMDRSAFVGYCAAWSAVVHAERALKADGYFVEHTNNDGHTNLVKHPAVQVKFEALRTMERFLTHFGMSPSTRGKVEGKPPEDPAGELARKYLM